MVRFRHIVQRGMWFLGDTQIIHIRFAKHPIIFVKYCFKIYLCHRILTCPVVQGKSINDTYFLA